MSIRPPTVELQVCCGADSCPDAKASPAHRGRCGRPPAVPDIGGVRDRPSPGMWDWIIGAIFTAAVVQTLYTLLTMYGFWGTP